MSSVDTRDASRDSLFLFAELRLDGRDDRTRVKVRNLSAGGMMVEDGGLAVSRGDRVVVDLRNVGTVRGSIAWVQGNRFGIAFENAVDPKLARAPVGTGDKSPRYTKAPLPPEPPVKTQRKLRSI